MKRTNENKDPLPASDSSLAIEILNSKGQETREGACEGADAKQHCEADLHGMTLVERGEKEHNAGKEAS